MRTFRSKAVTKDGVYSIRWLGPVEEVAAALNAFVIEVGPSNLVSFNSRMLISGEQEATIKWK